MWAKTKFIHYSMFRFFNLFTIPTLPSIKSQLTVCVNIVLSMQKWMTTEVPNEIPSSLSANKKNGDKNNYVNAQQEYCRTTECDPSFFLFSFLKNYLYCEKYYRWPLFFPWCQCLGAHRVKEFPIISIPLVC